MPRGLSATLPLAGLSVTRRARLLEAPCAVQARLRGKFGSSGSQGRGRVGVLLHLPGRVVVSVWLGVSVGGLQAALAVFEDEVRNDAKLGRMCPEGHGGWAARGRKAA